jgi:4,5:9,10-diseco-3-hydroxy-5,9,17-trioxoandrosta-1(10),2-diene-4-oate hydrolase
VNASTAAPRTEQTVRVGHRDIFVTEAGAGDPVVLLHGGGAGATGASNYSRNIDALAEHFRVIVPDMPGYGQSTKQLDFSDPFGDLAFAMRGMLDELGIDKAHFIGNSYGGAAALRLAMDRPDKVDRLILMGPGGVGTTRGLPTKGLNSLLGYYGGDGPTKEKLETFIREYLVYNGQSVPADLIDLRYQASIQPEVVANPPLRRPKSLGTALKMDFTRDRRLAKVQAPTLVVWGRDDKVNRPSGGPVLAQAMPNCDLYVVARTGHWVQWERAELFNSLAIDFLSAED